MIPDKCPKCGASPAQPFGGAIAWNCGSYSPYASGIVCQSPACLTDQRDQLAARVKRLEEYAQKLENAGDTLATVTLRNGRSHEQWHKAKEAQP